MLTLLLIFIFHIKHNSALNPQEQQFLCSYEGISGFPMPCSDSSNGCNYAGVLCNVNLSLVTFNIPLCGGTNIIPSQIGLLPYLTRFYITLQAGCTTPPQGTIPTEIGTGRLVYFGIPNLDVSGSIPSELFLNTKLTYLNVGYNRLSGTISSDLSKLTLLSSLILENNDGLSGTFPDVAGLTKLISFQISDNNFTGVLPQSGHMNVLKIYDVSSNSFTGDVTTFNSSLLFSVDMSGNLLHGTIPADVIIKTSNQFAISLKSNRLIGTIPSSLFTSSTMVIDLSSNYLSGTICSEITRMTPYGQQIIVERNFLSGSLPTELNGAEFSDLFKFNVGHNQLTGSIPNFRLMTMTSPSLTAPLYTLFRGFIYLNYNDNLFDGVVPNFEDFSVPTSIDLSSNKLSLNNNSFGSGTNITWLNLANNNISYLPVDMFSDANNFKSLLTLDLSFNQIIGTLPTLFHVQYLKLNNNLFTGVISDNLINSNYTNRPVFVDLTLNRLKIDGDRNTIFGKTSTSLSMNSEVVINLSPQTVNECLLQIDECQHECVDGEFPIQYPGGYTCGCFSGYQLSENRKNCSSVCGDGILTKEEICDFVFSPSGCNFDCTEKQGYTCDRIKCSPICGDEIVQMEEECDTGIGCNNCKVIDGFTCENNICQECANDDWINYPYPNNLELFPNLRALNYNLSLFEFSSCSSCSNGLSIMTRNVFSSSYCGNVKSSDVSQCSFACSNLTVFSSSTESIYSLEQQLNNGGFINQIINKLFGINVTIVNMKRDNVDTLNFIPSNCNSDMIAISNVINALSLDIVPNLPSSQIMIENCSVILSSTDATSESFPIGAIVGIVLGCSSLFVILSVICLLTYSYYSSELHYLPKEINWSFVNFLEERWKWTYVGNSDAHYYYRDYKVGSTEFDKIEVLLTKLKKGPLKPISIRAIYNPLIVNSFISQHKIMTERKLNSYDQFYTSNYRKNDEKMKIMDYYNKNISTLLDCNKDLDCEIIPCVHGTDWKISEKIALTSFASLNSLDSGYFAKGIYTSCNLCYCLPYCASKRNPSILLSYAVLGHIFPVDENHKGEKSLMGSSIRSGYSSHYVLTNTDGNVYQEGDGEICDEIVVAQESQLCPSFIIRLDPMECVSEFEKWKREILEPTEKSKYTVVDLSFSSPDISSTKIFQGLEHEPYEV